MSQLSKIRQSRNQWKHKATQRADQDRYLRKQLSRVKTERDRATQALKDTQARLRQLEPPSQGLAVRQKVDLVLLALQLMLVARIGFRAVSRVLSLLALALGITESAMPSNDHQLGDETLARPHPSGPEAEGVSPEPGTVCQRVDLAD